MSSVSTTSTAQASCNNSGCLGADGRAGASAEAIYRRSRPRERARRRQACGPQLWARGWLLWERGREALFVQLRIRQRAADPSSGTRDDLIRTVRGGRTIAPALNSVYGLGRLREQNVAAPVPDGEIDSACELSSRTRSRTIVECPPCLSLPPACDFASGTHPPAQCRLWSFE